jgi:hypothetical protein
VDVEVFNSTHRTLPITATSSQCRQQTIPSQSKFPPSVLSNARGTELTSSPSHEPNPDNTDNSTHEHLPLPTELMLEIITHIQHNRQYATLATMAQANPTLYDLVIPKLYETITITITNMSKLKYGCGSNVESGKNSTGHKAPVCPTSPPDNLSNEGRTPIEEMWTRKDRAIEQCLRLIIDVSVPRITESLHCLVDRLPHHRFGKVEEMMITVWGLDKDEFLDNNRMLSNILPPAGRRTSDNEALISIPKTKRVVLHLPSLDDTYYSVVAIPRINEWCRDRREAGRTQTEFEIYGINLDSRCESMNAECHFFEFRRHSEYRAPRNRATIAVDLSRWFIDNLGTGSKVQRVTIHASAVIDMGINTTDAAEANSTPRRTIEKDLKRQVNCIRDKSQAEKKVLIASIMERIVFGGGGFEQEEYPVLRPRPVSHLSRMRRIADLIDSRKRSLGITCDERWGRVRWRGIVRRERLEGGACEMAWDKAGI